MREQKFITAHISVLLLSLINKMLFLANRCGIKGMKHLLEKYDLQGGNSNTALLSSSLNVFPCVKLAVV